MANNATIKLRKGQTILVKVFNEKVDGSWLKVGSCPMRKYHGHYYYDKAGDCQKRVNKELTKILGYATIVQQYFYRPLNNDMYLVIVKTKKDCDYYNALVKLGFKEYQRNEAFA